MNDAETRILQIQLLDYSGIAIENLIDRAIADRVRFNLPSGGSDSHFRFLHVFCLPTQQAHVFRLSDHAGWVNSNRASSHTAVGVHFHSAIFQVIVAEAGVRAHPRDEISIFRFLDERRDLYANVQPALLIGILVSANVTWRGIDIVNGSESDGCRAFRNQFGRLGVDIAAFLRKYRAEPAKEQ